MIVDNASRFFDAIQQTGLRSQAFRDVARETAIKVLEFQEAEHLEMARALRCPLDKEKRILFWYGALMGCKIAFSAVKQHLASEAMEQGVKLQ